MTALIRFALEAGLWTIGHVVLPVADELNRRPGVYAVSAAWLGIGAALIAALYIDNRRTPR